MNALVLEAAEPTWWDRFRSGLSRPVPHAAALWDRWGRARGLGAPDDDIHPEAGLVRGAQLRAHQERLAPLLHGTNAVFEQTAEAAARHAFALLLADRDGVVVHTGGGGDFASTARRHRLI
jgi:transcriptional regulator of acetoin/glycerol metabolism